MDKDKILKANEVAAKVKESTNFKKYVLSIRDAMEKFKQDETIKSVDPYDDPVWQENFKYWLANPLTSSLRASGAEPAEKGEFQNCVAIKDDRGYIQGSGVLIGANVVLTAYHVIKSDFCEKIYMGQSAKYGEEESFYVVKSASIEIDQFDINTYKNDIGILILEEQVEGFARYDIAHSSTIDNAASMTAVGYGLDENNELGRKLIVELVVASSQCDASAAHSYNCNEGLEILAGGVANVGTCNGDSGGPVFVMQDGELRLAAITSRKSGYSCPSEFGFYTRIDKYIDQIRGKAREAGGLL